MEDVRKQDPTYTNFVPRNAAEAVDRYVRCRKNGLKPMLVPEREDSIREWNNNVYRENLRKFDEVPPLPCEDDEKVQEVE